MTRIFAVSVVLVFLTLCTAPEKKLPILGYRDVNMVEKNGETIADTIYHTIGDFRVHNQDGNVITNATFSDKIYVADFFFTTCPTICPVMTAQMLRVYDQYQTNDKVKLVSYTIDPKHDSVSVLKEYANKLEVSSNTWHFVRAGKDSIYNLAEKSYMVRAAEDQFAPGGFIHSGAFALVDPKRRIRGLYDGTRPEDVDRLIAEIRILLKEIEMTNE
jgi:protein SCO1/2